MDAQERPTEGYQFLIMASLAPDPEKTMFKPATLQILIKFFIGEYSNSG